MSNTRKIKNLVREWHEAKAAANAAARVERAAKAALESAVVEAEIDTLRLDIEGVRHELTYGSSLRTVRRVDARGLWDAIRGIPRLRDRWWSLVSVPHGAAVEALGEVVAEHVTTESASAGRPVLGLRALKRGEA